LRPTIDDLSNQVEEMALQIDSIPKITTRKKSRASLVGDINLITKRTKEQKQQPQPQQPQIQSQPDQDLLSRPSKTGVIIDKENVPAPSMASTNSTANSVSVQSIRERLSRSRDREAFVLTNKK